MTKQQPWWNGAVIYQLIVRSYADGNGDGIGDLQGLANRLPYLRWLGVEAIWLTPIYPSPLQDGGYDITDFKSIHPELGDLAAFHRVLIAAHSQGIKVVMDLVLNHTSTLHPWFQRARWAPEGSPERDVYVWSDDPKRYADAPVLFRHFESSNWEWDEVAQQYYLHRFLRHQPDLNYDSPLVQKEMLDVVDFWIERGVDGFRLDAVPFLFEAEGSRCEGLPETHEFLKRLRARVDSHGKDVLLLAEAIQPVEEAAPYLADDELHGAFNFALTAHLFASIASGTVEALRDCLQAAQNAVGGCRWALPLRNHDELWLGDGHLVPEDVIQTIRAGLHQGQGHWLNWGINRRLAPLLNGDPGSNRVMHALLYSLPGLPCLYYGDELGMGDWPGLRDRDPNRTPMAWTPGRNGGFSTAPDPLLVLPPITAPGYDYRVVNVEVQKQLPGSLLNWHRRMLTCRKLLPALRNGDFELLDCAHPGVIVYVRTNATMTVMVAANLSAAGASFRLDLSRWSGERTREVLWGCDFPPADVDWFVYLAAHGFSWWLIGEVEETDSSSEDSGVQEDKFSPAPSGVLGSPTPAS
ncbi:alpha-amylase family protein [Synechococcus sp. MVIR-18-1]|uniref:alpha-amylase family protein n=1 Tax=Synechococcus sp. MVIR-18-1 TaxID=1386941 RepID=UPI00164812A0|nr:alpha-amylase family protein [Synechococcus sp. MVIR-18-1]QNI75656.1 maltose alpha-D-glucosyltransferase / alpha-amylase [Synechococcus sp. MVIR-18-1]